MKKLNRASLAAATTLMLTALLAACGGGGGGGATPPTNGGGGGGTNTPTPPGSTATPPSTPTPPPGATGNLVIGASALANASVVFTCGCNGDGGKIQTDASGNYTISGSAPSVLNAGGTYTPTGHNLMVVGYAPSSHTQSWTMMFLGATPSHNITISPSSTVNTNDVASTAAALYIYYAASLINDTDKTFDWFNFNQIVTFTQHLRSSADGTEATLMADITSAQNAGVALYPGFVPSWNIGAGDTVNAKITADVQALVNDTGDSTRPTPCPAVNGCSNAPTP